MICGGLNSFPSIFAFRKWFDLKIWFLGQFFEAVSKKISDWTFNDCKVQLSWIVVPTCGKIRKILLKLPITTEKYTLISWKSSRKVLFSCF